MTNRSYLLRLRLAKAMLSIVVEGSTDFVALKAAVLCRQWPLTTARAFGHVLAVRTSSTADGERVWSTRLLT
jgi:hypothetical protein